MTIRWALPMQDGAETDEPLYARVAHGDRALAS